MVGLVHNMKNTHFHWLILLFNHQTFIKHHKTTILDEFLTLAQLPQLDHNGGLHGGHGGEAVGCYLLAIWELPSGYD